MQLLNLRFYHCTSFKKNTQSDIDGVFHSTVNKLFLTALLTNISYIIWKVEHRFSEKKLNYEGKIAEKTERSNE